MDTSSREAALHGLWTQAVLLAIGGEAALHGLWTQVVSYRW